MCVCSNSSGLVCWLSLAPVHVSVSLCSDFTVSRTYTLPDARCSACRPSQPSLPEQQAAPQGLAGELQRRLG